MDLVRLSMTGGIALASVLTLASLAHHGQAEPLPAPTLTRSSSVRAGAAARSPVLVVPTDRTPVASPSSMVPFGALSPFPGTADSARPTRLMERWDSGPSTWDGYIADASRRFGVPPNWIKRVMRLESGGQQFLRGLPITSPKGAMGLMQVMPATYAELRARYGLGNDPYDPKDNVLAGAAYLREMYDRFGAPGFLAAYNAGPRRFDDFLAHGRPLPVETQRYIAAAGAVGPGELQPAVAVQDLTVGSLSSGRGSMAMPAPRRPENAPLFIASETRVATDRTQADAPASDGLFIVLTGADRRQARQADGASGN